MQIFLVGGAVRDQLLGQPPGDRDWVIVGAKAEDITDLLAQGYRQVGKDFPVFLHPDSNEEYALARLERKTGPGYQGFSVTTEGVSLEEDLSRRDLSINAMAKDKDGNIIDPYGGREDLQAGLLRHVSPAFSEDPVRILRLARFAARYAHKGFTVAPETMTLMSEMVAAGEVDYLVAERVWKETERALSEPSPRQFFEVLRQCGALKVIMPELDALFGVPQRADHHPEIDTGLHSLMVLEQACKLSPKTSVRLAALIHDLGKAKTPADILPRHIGHERRSLPLIKKFCQRLRLPKQHSQLALHVAEYHTHCHRATELKGSTLAKLLKTLDAYRRPEQFEDFLLCCQADSCGRTGFEQRPYPQADYLRGALALANSISAKHIQAQGFSGKEIGEQLQAQRSKALGHYRSQHNEQQ
ncbi:MAG: multifunctional CCA addition/repair protein [Cellvibrionaceae bacterium]|nr:multifunctional CCA addition/repair protein [Cellvibrionaceae bacterium]